jgi:hypothetical protein
MEEDELVALCFLYRLDGNRLGSGPGRIGQIRIYPHLAFTGPGRSNHLRPLSHFVVSRLLIFGDFNTLLTHHACHQSHIDFLNIAKLVPGLHQP